MSVGWYIQVFVAFAVTLAGAIVVSPTGAVPLTIALAVFAFFFGRLGLTTWKQMGVHKDH